MSNFTENCREYVHQSVRCLRLPWTWSPNQYFYRYGMLFVFSS